jgi:tryptophan synthase alpha chain
MITHHELSERILAARPALVPYLTAGFPDLARFAGHLDGLTAVSPAVEIGVPFSDPMADGATIQESSRLALAGGATLQRIVALLGERENNEVPLIVMSYLNPILAFGIDSLMPLMAAAGVAALVVPDLPHEEAHIVSDETVKHGIGLVRLVTPLTDPERMELLCANSQGFVYAVTMAGTTGSGAIDTDAVAGYLDAVKAMSSVPVLAGFGVRTRDHVAQLASHCDGVIVGSAIVEAIADDEDPAEFVGSLTS